MAWTLDMSKPGAEAQCWRWMGSPYGATALKCVVGVPSLQCCREWAQRIIESLRLEKASRTTKSNHQPIPTNPHPQVPRPAPAACSVCLPGSMTRRKEMSGSKVTLPSSPAHPPFSDRNTTLSLQHQKGDQSNRIKHEKLLVAAFLFTDKAAWQLPSKNT